MSDTALRHDMQALLEQSSWVRELARRLASGADADDVEQATWLAALRTRTERHAPARDWLASVVRNFARQEQRARGRRVEHEQRAARGEALPSTVDLLARAELQRKLVGAVMQLDEPYRTALLLRYFENLPPRVIAERLGTPVATVRTRIARALERLRERFDAEHGGARDAWLQALAPLCLDASPATPGLGALIVLNAKIVVACVVLCAVGALAWWMSGAGRTAAQSSEASAPSLAQPAPAARASTTGAAAAIEVEREATAPAQAPSSVVRQSPAAPAPAAQLSLRITGRVIDPEGAGVEDARVLVRAADAKDATDELSALTGPGGAFQFESGPASGLLACDGGGMTTLLAITFSATAREDLVLVAAPRLELAGLVVDERGAPVAGARASLEMPDDLRARLGVVLDRAQPQHWRADSAADGAFDLDGAPQVEGSRLLVAADGFLPWNNAAPQHTDAGMRIVLARAPSADGFVRGVVVDGASQPIAGAYVAFGVDTLRTASDGAFAFRIDDPTSFSRRVGAKPRKVSAVAAGFALTSFEPPSENGAPVWPSHVRLVLEQPTLTLSGRVVDASDAPLAGVRVYVSDPTLLGVVDGDAAAVETLFAPGEGGWRYVESDERGRFELGGLLDREYVVRAHDSRTLLRVDSEPVRAGRSGLKLRVPTDQLYPRVAGRVVSHGGTPIAGAEVFAMCDALQLKYEGQIVSTSHDARDATTTDAQGRFVLENVPRSLAYLRVNGATILPLEYGRYVEGDRRFVNAVRELPRERIEDLEIRVDARCHMQVELAVTDLADSLAVLDANGAELEMSLFEATARSEGRRQPLHNGRTAMLSVPETGRTLVLFKDGVEVTRSGIELDPSKPTTIRR